MNTNQPTTHLVETTQTTSGEGEPSQAHRHDFNKGFWRSPEFIWSADDNEIIGREKTFVCACGKRAVVSA